MEPLAIPDRAAAASPHALPVFEHVAGDRLLLVPLVDGAADLDAAVALNDTARALWRELVQGGDEVALARALAGSAGRASAADDVAAFLRELQARSLIAGDGVAPRAEAQPAAAATDPATLDAAQVVALARAVVRRGHRLRFAARGLSMRPQIAHGAILEIAAREPARVRAGDVILYAAGDQQLVAHRVLRRAGSTLLARGDSASRVDQVQDGDVLGVVIARLDAGGGPGRRRVDLDTPLRRALGRTTSALHRGLRGALRLLVVRPLRASPALRRCAATAVRLCARALHAVERRGARWGRRFDVATAALMPAAEKDRRRRALYARASVQAFTALDENVEAGLTLIEEVMLARHPLPAGPILVLGCGPGRECVALARAGHRITGLDRDAGMLARARALAELAGVPLDLVAGEADAFDLGAQRFAAVLVFSGLYNMLLPSARRVALLRCAAAHLEGAGRVYLTFLSDYAPPDALPPPRARTLGTAIDDDHEDGDLWLRNEAVHVFPHSARLLREAADAGLRSVALFRDQRAYDRATRQVRGYVVLERAR